MGRTQAHNVLSYKVSKSVCQVTDFKFNPPETLSERGSVYVHRRNLSKYMDDFKPDETHCIVNLTNCERLLDEIYSTAIHEESMLYHKTRLFNKLLPVQSWFSKNRDFDKSFIYATGVSYKSYNTLYFTNILTMQPLYENSTAEDLYNRMLLAFQAPCQFGARKLVLQTFGFPLTGFTHEAVAEQFEVLCKEFSKYYEDIDIVTDDFWAYKKFTEVIKCYRM